MKALILAESCNPEWESVPLVGWSHYHALSQLVDTHLVTRTRNLPELLRAGLVEGRDFTVIDTEALFAPMAKFVEMIAGPNKGWAMLQALSLPSYFAFEHIAWKRFAKRIEPVCRQMQACGRAVRARPDQWRAALAQAIP